MTCQSCGSSSGECRRQKRANGTNARIGRIFPARAIPSFDTTQPVTHRSLISIFGSKLAAATATAEYAGRCGPGSRHRQRRGFRDADIRSVTFGVSQSIAVNSDGNLAAPSGSIPGLSTKPAKLGAPRELIILATGWARSRHPYLDGAASTETLRTTVATPVVLVGGIPQFVGVNQVMSCCRRIRPPRKSVS